MRDKLRRSAHQIESAVAITSSDLQNRAKGISASAKHLFGEEPPDAEVLVARVRSKIGRLVSHPSSLEVSADNGVVTLRGPILEHELGGLLACVGAVSGVREVRNELETHRTAQGVPGLQGGVHRSGHKFELLQKNWSPTARLLAGLGGAAAMLYCSTRRNRISLTVGTAGFGLLARALTNREVSRLVGVGTGRNTVNFAQTIQINSPIEKVFAFWQDYSNFPKFMTHVREITDQGDGKSHWVIDGPGGSPIEWDAVITKLITNNTLAWKTVGESAIDHAGIVRFTNGQGGSTTVHVEFFYNPPAGLAGHSIASLLGFDPKTKMREDLARLKTVLEVSNDVRASSATQTSRA
jgi:uncharacterized membrane protein